MGRSLTNWLIVFEDGTTQTIETSEFSNIIYMDLEQDVDCIQCIIRL